MSGELFRYPMKLSCIIKSPVWGGRELLDRWGMSDGDTHDNAGEVWTLSVRQKEMCGVENGIYAGKELGGVLGTTAFPLLVKLIDARDKLSVQVHPDDAYAAATETEPDNRRGKTEMWYILDAKKDARIVYGLRPDVGLEEFRRAITSGDVMSMLNSVDVHAGDVFFIPPGLPHAIGGGILLAEVQQNCDLTYRIYDYNRPGKDGKPRELHRTQAADVVRTYTDAELHALRFSGAGIAPSGGNVLADCPYFGANLLSKESAHLKQETFSSVLCVAGGTMECAGEAYAVKRGDCYFLPAGIGCVTARDGAVLLVSSCKS